MSNYQTKLAACKQLDITKVLVHFNIYWNGISSHIKCPFPKHAATGNTPSFKIYEDTNSFYCWGCRKGGSAVEFVMSILNYSKIHAVDYLIDKFKIKFEPSFLIKMTSQLLNSSSTLDIDFKIIETCIKYNRETCSKEERIRLIMELYGIFMVQTKCLLKKKTSR